MTRKSLLQADWQWTTLFAAWLVALTATLGALFLGEVMGMTPCVLCWYQRIAMFPLVIVLGLGLFPLDTGCVRYAFPLAAAGWCIALYHCLLYWGLIPKGLVPCGKDVSCTEANLNLLGFISIPLMSWAAFTAILVLLFLCKRQDLHE
jgi:disulfide bond formation protein DsbB